jgi:hypothetical protein
MKTKPATFKSIETEVIKGFGSDAYAGEIICPACGGVWLTVEWGFYTVNKKTECSHIKFAAEIFGADLFLHYFNGCTVADLMSAIAPPDIQNHPDQMKAFESFLLKNMPEKDFWPKITARQFNSALTFFDCDEEEDGVRYIAIFGASL